MVDKRSLSRFHHFSNSINPRNTIGIHYSDWSYFDTSDDYSYAGNTGNWAINDKIVVTNRQGHLLAGTFPTLFIDFDYIPGDTSEKPVSDIYTSTIEGIDINYHFPGATMSFKESEGELYQIINVDAFGLSNEPGKPALPFRIYHMLLPDDAEARVQLNFVYSRTYEGFNIHPAQMEIIADEEDVHDYSFIKDEEFITYFVSGNRIFL